MSSLFQKNNFSIATPPNENPNFNHSGRRNPSMTGGNANPIPNLNDNSDIPGPAYPLVGPNPNQSLLSPGPSFGAIPGVKGLSPFCGTFYDQRFSGNHLDGIHIEPVLAIDSKSRNHSKYPNPNAYDLQLKTTYKDVTKVELKFALIPNSGYVINHANNLFYFQDRKEQVDQCKYYQIELPLGDWPAENTEGPSISSILETEMNRASCAYGHRHDCNVSSSVPYNACICNCSTSIASHSQIKTNSKNKGLHLKRQDKNKKNKNYCCEDESECESSDDSCFDVPSKYAVTFCKYRRKFTIKQIKGSGVFNIIFCGGLTKVGEQGTVTHPIMGVDRFLSPEVPITDFQKKYISRSIGPVLGFSPKNLLNCLTYTSDGVINFDRDRYVILRIPQFERLQSNSDPLDGAFAIIAATRIANDFIFAKWDQDPFNSESYTKYFNPPLPNLSKLRIEFYNCDGEPFDFNGLNHLLLFDIGSLTQQTIFPLVSTGTDSC